MKRLCENELMMNSNRSDGHLFKSGLYNSAVSNNACMRKNNATKLDKFRHQTTMLGFLNLENNGIVYEGGF